MKILLLLSLSLNAIFVYRMMNHTEPKKRVKIQELDFQLVKNAKLSKVAKNSVVEDSISTKSAKSAEMKEDEVPMSEKLAEVAQMDEQEFLQLQEKVGEDRREFMEKVGISEAAMLKADKIIRRHDKETTVIFEKNQGLLSLDDRKILLEMEESMAAELQKVYGESRYNKFEALRKKYNDGILEGFQSGNSGQPQAFVLMGP